MKTKTIFELLILILSFGCMDDHGKHTINIFIPMNYTGWLNIIHEDSNSKNRPLIFDGNYVYIITGNPEKYRVFTKAENADWYTMNYYCYNIDTTFKILWKNSKHNIFFEQTIYLHNYDEHRNIIGDKPISAFYVNKEAVQSISESEVPKNIFLK